MNTIERRDSAPIVDKITPKFARAVARVGEQMDANIAELAVVGQEVLFGPNDALRAILPIRKAIRNHVKDICEIARVKRPTFAQAIPNGQMLSDNTGVCDFVNLVAAVSAGIVESAQIAPLETGDKKADEEDLINILLGVKRGDTSTVRKFTYTLPTTIDGVDLEIFNDLSSENEGIAFVHTLVHKNEDDPTST